jgi:ribosomal-protein-alanine N-acetyltransferase
MTNSPTYFLTTARLGFRHWTMDDLPQALSLWGDPQVTRLIGGPLSEEGVKKKLMAEIALMATHHAQYWPLFLLRNNDHVGCVGLRPYRTADQIYELGFHLLPAHWGQGLAEEAGRAVVTFAFEKLNVKGLFAGHHPENAASKKVLGKLGFRLTGEEFYAPTGLKHPSYLLLRS